MALFDRKLALEAVKLAFPKGGHPPLLVHTIPEANFWVHEARELRSFKLGTAEQVQIRDNKPEYTVVVLPSQLADKGDRKGVVWGIVRLDTLRKSITNKWPLTPRVCRGPGAEHRKQVAQAVEAARVQKIVAECIPRDIDFYELVKKARAIQRYQTRHRLGNFDVERAVRIAVMRTDGSMENHECEFAVA